MQESASGRLARVNESVAACGSSKSHASMVDGLSKMKAGRLASEGSAHG